MVIKKRSMTIDAMEKLIQDPEINFNLYVCAVVYVNIVNVGDMVCVI